MAICVRALLRVGLLRPAPPAVILLVHLCDLLPRLRVRHLQVGLLLQPLDVIAASVAVLGLRVVQRATRVATSHRLRARPDAGGLLLNLTGPCSTESHLPAVDAPVPVPARDLLCVHAGVTELVHVAWAVVVMIDPVLRDVHAVLGLQVAQDALDSEVLGPIGATQDERGLPVAEVRAIVPPVRVRARAAPGLADDLAAARLQDLDQLPPFCAVPPARIARAHDGQVALLAEGRSYVLTQL
mmetsp:Transcript_56864/g.128017  ORF Transcript_56864/g.128017 Transcript_56864/m.128017 type:complete len:241 (-) Transcript_56864:135-857(-)